MWQEGCFQAVRGLSFWEWKPLAQGNGFLFASHFLPAVWFVILITDFSAVTQTTVVERIRLFLALFGDAIEELILDTVDSF